MKFRDYLHKKHKRRKKEVDSLEAGPASTSSYTTYHGDIPLQFPVFNQPMGGPVSGISGAV